MARCQNRDSFGMFTGSQDLSPWPPSMASLANRVPWSSRSSGVKKNGVRVLRASVGDILRSAAASRSRPLLRRQARLSGLLHSPGGLSVVRRREDRRPRLVGRQSVLHETIRLLRGTTLPGEFGQSRGRGVVPGLARGQGVGQAVHERATAACRPARTQGDRHRRDRHRQRPQLPHRGERSDPRPAHLVRRQRPIGS